MNFDNSVCPDFFSQFYLEIYFIKLVTSVKILNTESNTNVGSEKPSFCVANEYKDNCLLARKLVYCGNKLEVFKRLTNQTSLIFKNNYLLDSYLLKIYKIYIKKLLLNCHKSID